MKAILEFNLPEDKEEFDTALKGMDWALLVLDIDHNLKKKLTHKFESQPKEWNVFGGVDETFKYINNLFEEYNVNLEEIIE